LLIRSLPVFVFSPRCGFHGDFINSVHGHHHIINNSSDPATLSALVSLMDILSQRQKIISSVFDKRNAAGSDELYVAHVKIWEDPTSDGPSRKPRYILLSRTSPVTPSPHSFNSCPESPAEGGYIHKSKLNTNGTFSVGKTWRLRELRALQVVNVCPLTYCCFNPSQSTSFSP